MTRFDRRLLALLTLIAVAAVAAPAARAQETAQRAYVSELPPLLDRNLFFDDPQLGEPARKLFDDARELLQRVVDEKLLTARGVYGFWPAASRGDDIIVFADESRTKEKCRVHALRHRRTIDTQASCIRHRSSR